MRATALVIEATPPVTGASGWGNAGRGTVTILVDRGSEEPIYAARSLRLSEDRWLVPGMEIPVSIDPAEPKRFEVEWDAIPSIEQRVAANDPTLADPSAALRKVATALESAGISGPPKGPSSRGMAGGGVVGVESAGGSPPDLLEQAIRNAAQKPAPPGKQRAVVVVATIAGSGDSSSGEVIDPNTNGPP
jgi:hypothetical protein